MIVADPVPGIGAHPDRERIEQDERRHDDDDHDDDLHGPLLSATGVLPVTSYSALSVTHILATCA